MASPLGPRVLSIQQPWAWAIVSGRKKVENRSWSTAYRGPLYIHASMKIDRVAIKWLHRRMRLAVPDQLPTGAVIGVCDLVDVVTRSHARRFGKWFFGPYGFVLANARPLHRRVPMKGRLGLFHPSGSVARRVRTQLRRRR